MKLAVILAVAMVMMMGQDVQSWRSWRGRAISRTVATAAIIILGKRSGDADFDAATEDDVLTADEISALLGLEGLELADFIAEADMNGDGQIDIEEFVYHDAKDY